MDKRSRITGLIWILIVVIDLVLVYLNESTYDSGDSILHYLFAKQAFSYPQHFLNHWAKPLFVLLSSPFAVLGWNGMKLFNSLCVLGSAYYTFLLFKSYDLRKWLAVLLVFAAPKFFLVQASGLTEPLFTLLLIAIIYHLKREHIKLAVIILSFLPFVRSEGWIIWLIVGTYLIIQKHWKSLPFILSGSVFYGIIGLIAKGNFLWMFNENPYSGNEAKYGNGEWMHYIDQLPYVIGFPLFLFLLIGLFDGFQRSARNSISKHEFFLIYGTVIGYIVAHSVFWKMGWFHSFGLNRVLIVLIPLIAFIAYRGIERLICAFSFLPSKVMLAGASLLLIVFPFSSNKAALGLPESIEKEPLQQMIDRIAVHCDSTYGSDIRVYYGNTYVVMSFDKDMDKPSEAMKIGMLKQYDVLPNSLVIWDSYFSVTDQEIETESLRVKEGLEFVQRFDCEECRKRYYVDLYKTTDLK